MDYYRIKSVVHSGNYGERGSARMDGMYPFRMGVK